MTREQFIHRSHQFSVIAQMIAIAFFAYTAMYAFAGWSAFWAAYSMTHLIRAARRRDLERKKNSVAM